MDDRARKIVGDVVEEIVADVISDPGKADDYPTKSMCSRVLTAYEEAGSQAENNTRRRGMLAESVLAGDRAEELAKVLVRDIKKSLARGVKPLRVKRIDLDVVDVEFEGGRQRAGVKPNLKQEMADMAKTGLTVSEIALHYGFPEPDVRRILKSVKVVALEVQSPVEPPLAPAPEPAPEVSSEDLIEALESVAEDASHSEVEVTPADMIEEAIAYRCAQRSARQARHVVDPTTEGEILYCTGAGPNGWRIEIAPQFELKLGKDISDLRSYNLEGGMTEFDIVNSNIRLFADDALAKSDKKFKTFSREGYRVSEFKGRKARIFCGIMTSTYPDGRKVRRCGLVMCSIKGNVDPVPKAIERIEAWRAWRTAQDENIAEGVSMKPRSMRRINGGEATQRTPTEIIRSTEMALMGQIQGQVEAAMERNHVSRDQLAAGLGLDRSAVDLMLESPDAAIHDLAALAALLNISFRVTSYQSGS